MVIQNKVFLVLLLLLQIQINSIDAHGGQTDIIYDEVKVVSKNGHVNQLTGYFYARESGIHATKIKNVNAGAMIWFGNDYAFACCQPDNIPYDSEQG